MQLKGRRVILTGASGGIGRAVALALAARGASVVLSGRDRTRLEHLASEIAALGGRAEVVVADLLAPEETRCFLQYLEKETQAVK